jgi:hypothetical protein
MILLDLSLPQAGRRATWMKESFRAMGQMTAVRSSWAGNVGDGRGSDGLSLAPGLGKWLSRGLHGVRGGAGRFFGELAARTGRPDPFSILQTGEGRRR